MSEITLVVDTDQIKVDKKNLIDKSRYFSSLFSHDFSDSKENVHVVNYKVSKSVVKDLCSWIEEDYPSLRNNEDNTIKISLQKFLSDNFVDLKQLIHLSVIYMVDDLTLELSGIVIQQWLKPELLLEIWKLSRELNLTTLRDITFSRCLERFLEIPADSIINLPIDDFLELLGNVNIVAYKNYLQWVIKKKLANEDDPYSENGTKEENKLLQLHEINNAIDRKPSLMHCFFTETLKLEKGNDVNVRLVYSFQENPVKFTELLELWRMEEPRPDLAGMGVVGRGFNIYKVGGERRLGSEKFNMNVWRHCLLSKKLYYVARLRKPRRHMVTALVENKLILIGGVGRYRCKSSLVEILDLYTDTWTNAPDAPETFTDFPPSCVINGMVAFCVSSIYMFNPFSNTWINVNHSIDCKEIAVVKCLAANRNTLFLGKEDGVFVGYDVIWDNDNSNEDKERIQSCTLVLSNYKQFTSPCDKIMIFDECKFVGIVYGFERLMIECGTLKDSEKNFFESKFHSFPLPCATVSPISCFDLIDPSTLYKKIY